LMCTATLYEHSVSGPDRYHRCGLPKNHVEHSASHRCNEMLCDRVWIASNAIR
jgi:hypothetical protein